MTYKKDNKNIGQDIKDLESQLHEALDKRDPLAYAQLCDYLGRSPECGLLYEQGLAELAFQSSIDTYYDNLAQDASYTNFIKDFLDKACKVSLNPSKATEYKQALLMSSFPDKFGKGKKQDLTSADNFVIGVIYRNVVNSYNKIKDQKRF